MVSSCGRSSIAPAGGVCLADSEAAEAALAHLEDSAVEPVGGDVEIVRAERLAIELHARPA